MKLSMRSMKTGTRWTMIISLIYIVVWIVVGGDQVNRWGNLVGISINPMALLIVAIVLCALALYAGTTGQGILQAVTGLAKKLTGSDDEEELEECPVIRKKSATKSDPTKRRIVYEVDEEEEEEDEVVAEESAPVAPVRRRRTVARLEKEGEAILRSELDEELDIPDPDFEAAVKAVKPKAEVIDMPFAPETLAEMAKSGVTMQLVDGKWTCVPLK